MATLKDIKVNFRVYKNHQMAERAVNFKNVKPDIYLLPDGKEVFIAEPVRRMFASISLKYLNDQFEKLMECIDTGGSEKKMVPVRRVGDGPTEKSARFGVVVTQKIEDIYAGRQEQKEKELTFTLPVSQIENVGEQLAAPLWLILEKLDAKQNSEFGAKARKRESIVGEFIPSSKLKAASSARVVTFKNWLTELCAELEAETASKSAAIRSKIA
jgi:hypothetical protein